MSDIAKLRKQLRQAVADYMRSEGCGCCSGYDFSKYRSKK